MRLRMLVIGMALAGVMSFGVFAAGCGSDDETSSTSAASSDEATEEPAEEESATTTTPAAGGETLKVEMGEFYFKPADVTAKAGTITIDAPNVGNAPHELVLAKTNDDPAKLPTASDGSVDEDSLDVPGEVEEVEAGGDGTVTLDLQAGKYAMFCNLPGHYKGGMYGSLTVK